MQRQGVLCRCIERIICWFWLSWRLSQPYSSFSRDPSLAPLGWSLKTTFSLPIPPAWRPLYNADRAQQQDTHSWGEGHKKHSEAWSFWRLPHSFKETVKYESAVVLGTPTTALIPLTPPPLLKRGLCACRAPISYLLTGRAWLMSCPRRPSILCQLLIIYTSYLHQKKRQSAALCIWRWKHWACLGSGDRVAASC